ncbi:MAG: DUF4263 domain-containing protein [Clostridia bacterium]|nr:DUF4263 domain-containing protein [Clostridia bacterium]
MNTLFDPDYDDKKKQDSLLLRPTIWSDSSSAKHRKVEMLYDEDCNISEKRRTLEPGIEGKMTIIKEYPVEIFKGGQQKLVCDVISYHPDDWEEYGKKGALAIKIARRCKRGVYGNQEISLTLENALKVKSFIEQIFQLNEIFDKNIRQIPLNSLSPDFNTIEVNRADFNKIIQHNLVYIDYYDDIVSLHKRKMAIEQLKIYAKGEGYSHETQISKFFKKNLWFFNSEYVFFSNIDIINPENIADILPINIENFIDIIEVKLPTEKLFNFDKSHNNYYPTHSLNMAISQTQNYLFNLEKQNTRKNDFESKIIKPKATIVIGSSLDLSQEEKKYLRILNSSYHNINIVTYQQLIDKAESLFSYTQKKTAE